MTVRHFLICSVAALLCISPPPVRAAAPGSLGDGHGIYLGESKILDVESTRQLTLRENVLEYQFSPSGEKIAYVTSVDDHGDRYFAIKIVDTWRQDPEIKTLVKMPIAKDAKDPEDFPFLRMVGWAGDDRYLLFKRIELLLDHNMALTSVHLESRDLTMADGASDPTPVESIDTEQSQGSLEYAWASAHDQLLVDRVIFHWDGKPSRRERSYYLYDPLTAKLRPLTVDPADVILGWVDGAHLLMVRTVKGAKPAYRQYDLATGTASDASQPEWWDKFPDLHLDELHDLQPASDPKDPSLVLAVVDHRLPAAQELDQAPASTVWIQRDSAIKRFSVLPLGVTPGYYKPQAQWSPTGKAVAFIAHGDLFLTTLVKRPANAWEKLAVGETLNCDEEKQIATSNVKQIGLGIIQYSQDHDENYPSVTGFHDKIYPYIKSESVFSVGGHAFIYHAPANLSLASLDAPAELVIGEMDMPCARIVLYADGHVKAQEK
ncbi:hypothetical protein CCAX7_007410 [Capsulimonas corticalis]|uniref:Uncharacterized protein n=1 Tax=Capsulimonas corticalis TaxID=2219043 RepID=A0A402D1L9_9BACT|nr:hypothetical protein [Capsulimonas corticalis]BDI28690.1 hypothetical protein CCAX7_007410 [Capsulimonas corticalis]